MRAASAAPAADRACGSADGNEPPTPHAAAKNPMDNATITDRKADPSIKPDLVDFGLHPSESAVGAANRSSVMSGYANPPVTSR
jgi:hypothetical protein